MNLTRFLLDLIFYAIGLDPYEEETKMTFLHYFMHKNLIALFGKEDFLDEEIQLKKEANGTISFDYAGEKYTLFMEEKQLILRKNFNEIAFHITLKEHCIHNFIQYQEDDKMIQEFQEANFEKETYIYHRVSSTDTQEVHSVKLEAIFESKISNIVKDQFKIIYVHPKECKKTSWGLYWDKKQKKNIFLVSSIDFFEQLNEIFTYLEERCSKEYARIKLK